MQNLKFKMKNSKKGLTTGKLLITLMAITALGVGIYTTYRYVKNNLKITRGPEANLEKPEWFKTAKETKETLATVAPVPKPDFVADGRLFLHDEGEETENWTFSSEDLGKSAGAVYLAFNFHSLCDYGSGEQLCNTKKLENRLRVHIEGTKNGQNVTVIKLKVL